MGLETPVTKISDLNPLWPLGSDQKLSGDDHIRNIKLALQTVTFLKSIQTFTVSGTWTRPAGIKSVLVYCLGGGAGGNGSQPAENGGGGGGGGGVGIKLLDVTALASVTVSIGAPGTAGASAGGIGGAGGITAFSVGATFYCIGSGGSAGPTYREGGRGGLSTSSVGDIRFSGGAGTPGEAYVPASGLVFLGGNGGGNGAGISGAGAYVATPNSGGGGAGGYTAPAGSIAGGQGATGYCVVLEFGQ
jgi:hypothetical protein